MTLPYRLGYVPADTEPGPQTLALVRYDNTQATDARIVNVPLSLLSAPYAEHWVSDLPVEHGHADGFSYAHNSRVLLAQVRIDESELHDLATSARKLYLRIGAFLQAHGYPHCLRTWNYFHDIHRGEGDRERYRQFVAGRYEALVSPQFERQLPAATAIGAHHPGLLVYFLAAREPGTQIENPRQTSAFRYPSEYGPRSPSFSRATLMQADGSAQLLVSGTASIVGHATRHIGDAAAQLDEIVQNLRALLEQARAQSQLSGQWHAQALKLYVRDPAQALGLEARLRAALGDDVPLICLHGDICRRDLLVEIEGIYAL